MRPAGKVAWRAIGPGVNGENIAVAFHPANPKIMLAGTDMGVMFRTEDSGKRWKMLGARNEGDQPGYRGAWNAVFDPKRPDIAWAASSCGIYKSTDTGKTWKRMTKSIGATTHLMFRCIGIDPTDTDIVYIGFGAHPQVARAFTSGRIWKTTDGGTTWAELPRPGGPLIAVNEKSDEIYFANSRSYTDIRVDQNSAFEKGRGHLRVYVYGRGGFFVSNDAGQSWESLADKFPASSLFGDMVIVTEQGKSVLFVTVQPSMVDEKKQTWTGGIYRSDDNGKTWRTSHSGMEKDLSKLAAANGNITIENSIKKQTRAVMLANSPAMSNVLYAGGLVSGVYRSDNLGMTWAQTTFPNIEWHKTKDYYGKDCWYMLRRPGGNLTNSYQGTIGNFENLVVSATDVNFVAFTDSMTTNLSRDGGKTWESLLHDYAEPFDAGRYGDSAGDVLPTRLTHRVKDRGAQVIVPADVAVDPFDKNTIFCGYMDLFLQISRDNGVSWETPTRNFISYDYKTTEAESVVFDPAVRGKAWVAIRSQHLGVGSRVYLTEDGGRIFRPVGIEPLTAYAESLGLNGYKHVTLPRTPTATSITQLTLDPKSPPNKRTLYAATGYGIYKSIDDGNTWKDSSLGLNSPPEIRQLVINPKNTDILYAGGYTKREGLYRSSDAGLNWVRIAADKIGGVVDISICKEYPNVVYVIACDPGCDRKYKWTKSKLWRTDDGGNSWRVIEESHLGTLVGVHPLDPNYVYYGFMAEDINAGSPGFVRSRDGGKTWEDISADIPLCEPSRVCFDENDPARFFLLEYFSVFEGRDGAAPGLNK